MGQDEKPQIITPALVRAGRGFLDWTQTELAERAGISRSTVKDYEAGRHAAHRATEAQLRLAFEKGGLEFVATADGAMAICQTRTRNT